MKQILKDREDIVFYIKMFPLKMHPTAYKKAKAIVCEKSLRLLEDAFKGRTLPEPSCETEVIDENIKLAKRLGITGTPTVILPDGAVVRGYKNAGALIKLINKAVESLGARQAEETEIEATETGVEATETETEAGSETETETETGPETEIKIETETETAD